MEILLKQESSHFFEEEFSSNLCQDLESEMQNKISLKKNKSQRSENFSRKSSFIRNDSNLTRHDSTLRRNTRKASEDRKDTNKFFNFLHNEPTSYNNITSQNKFSQMEEDSKLTEPLREYKEDMKEVKEPKRIKKTPKPTLFLTINKKQLAPFNDSQIKLLFKDFISDDLMDNSHLDFCYKLENGIYHEEFYQSVYNKYNGLTESLAHKRKHVCLKLLNILKLIV